jgi:hypothetical protein
VLVRVPTTRAAGGTDYMANRRFTDRLVQLQCAVDPHVGIKSYERDHNRRCKMASGDDIQAGRITGADSITDLVGETTDEGIDFSGDVILRVGPNLNQQPNHKLDGIHGLGFAGVRRFSGGTGVVGVGGAGRTGGSGVVGFGGPDGGIGLMGVAGGKADGVVGICDENDKSGVHPMVRV